MTSEEIIEGNQICAQFLGYVNTTPTDKDFNIYENKEGKMLEAMSMKFHSDWNWLMEVVEKIRDYRTQRFTDTTAGTLKTEVYHFVGRCRIEESFKAVVQFIKWYNENNK